MIGATETPTGTPASARVRMRAQAHGGAGGAWFEFGGERAIERSDREDCGAGIPACQFSEDVGVAGDEMVFGDDANRIAELGKHFEATARDA